MVKDRFADRPSLLPLRALLLRPLRLRGATLVETIAAAAMLGIGVSLLGQFMFQTVRDSRLANRQAQAMLLAQEKAEVILAHRANLAAWEARAAERYPVDPENDLHFIENQRLPEFRWRWEIKDVEDRPGMKQIMVRAFWRVGKGGRDWLRCEILTMAAVPGPA